MTRDNAGAAPVSAGSSCTQQTADAQVRCEITGIVNFSLGDGNDKVTKTANGHGGDRSTARPGPTRWSSLDNAAATLSGGPDNDYLEAVGPLADTLNGGDGRRSAQGRRRRRRDQRRDRHRHVPRRGRDVDGLARRRRQRRRQPGGRQRPLRRRERHRRARSATRSRAARRQRPARRRRGRHARRQGRRRLELFGESGDDTIARARRRRRTRSTAATATTPSQADAQDIRDRLRDRQLRGRRRRRLAGQRRLQRRQPGDPPGRDRRPRQRHRRGLLGRRRAEGRADGHADADADRHGDRRRPRPRPPPSRTTARHDTAHPPHEPRPRRRPAGAEAAGLGRHGHLQLREDLHALRRHRRSATPAPARRSSCICTGKGCPKPLKPRTIAKDAAKLTLKRPLGKAKLKVGTRFEVRVERAGSTIRTRYTVRPNRARQPSTMRDRSLGRLYLEGGPGGAARRWPRGGGCGRWSACRRRPRGRRGRRGAGRRSARACGTRGSAAGARTVVRARRIERTASRPSARRQAAARQRAWPYATPRTSASSANGPTANQRADGDERARQHRRAAGSGARRAAAGGSRPRGSSASSGRNSSRNALDVAHAHEREQRARRRGLVGVARDLDRQRRQPERAPEDALDHPHGAHPPDRHRRLAARDEPAADPQPVAVAGHGEAAEGDDRARASRAATRARSSPAAPSTIAVAGVRERAHRLLAAPLVEELLDDLPGAREHRQDDAELAGGERGDAAGRARRAALRGPAALVAGSAGAACGRAARSSSTASGAAPAARSRRPSCPRRSGCRPRRRRTRAAAGPGGRRCAWIRSSADVGVLLRQHARVVVDRLGPRCSSSSSGSVIEPTERPRSRGRRRRRSRACSSARVSSAPPSSVTPTITSSGNAAFRSASAE